MRLLPERDCENCPAQNRVRWGCEADAPIPIVFDGERTLRCPRKPYLDNPGWFHSIFEAHSWRDKGFLPNGGTWRDQDNRFVVFCSVIDSAKAEADSETSNAQEAKRAQVDRQAKPKGGHPAGAWGGRR